MKPPAYQKGQIVWAKVRGYPWWPAIVNETNQKKNGSVDKNVTLTFLAENKIGVIPTNRIRDYESEFDELSLMKNKKLQEAIKIALDEYGVPKKAKNIAIANVARNTEDIDMQEEGKNLETKEEENEKVGENGNESREPDAVDKETNLKGDLKENKNTEEHEEIPRIRPKRGEDKSKKEDEHLSKLEKKKKIKEEEKSAKYQDSIDLFQRRSTRSQAKTDKIEMFTEPLIYSCRKSKKREKGSDKDNDDGSMIDEYEDNRGPENENKTPKKEKVYLGTNTEEKKTKNKNLLEAKKEAGKLNLGKRAMLDNETGKKIDNYDINEQSETESSKRRSGTKNETNKKIKLENETSEKTSEPLEEYDNQKTNDQHRLDFTESILEQDFKDEKNLEREDLTQQPIKPKEGKIVEIDNSQSDNNSESQDQRKEYTGSTTASSSSNLIANNDIQTEKKAEIESYPSEELPKQATSVNIETVLTNFNQPAPKNSKSIDLKNIKIVNQTQTNDAFLRKSVCQKLAKLLEEVYSMDKDSAQELTLYIEGRINSYFTNDMNYYKKVMKILYKLMKVKMLQFDELRTIINLEYHEFKLWLQKKIETAISLKEETLSRTLTQGLQKDSSPIVKGSFEDLFTAEDNQEKNKLFSHTTNGLQGGKLEENL